MRTAPRVRIGLLVLLIFRGLQSSYAYPTRRVFDTHVATGVQFFFDSDYQPEQGRRIIYWSPRIEIQKSPDGSIQCFERATEKGVELTLTVKLVRPNRALNWASGKH